MIQFKTFILFFLGMALPGMQNSSQAASLSGIEIVNTIRTFAGTPQTGFAGNTCGSGSSATAGWPGGRTANPWSLAIDPRGNLFVGDTTFDQTRIWKISPGQPPVVAVASSQLGFPRGLSVDANGTVFVAESNANRVVKYTTGNPNPTVVAGAAAGGFDPTNTLASSTPLASPSAVIAALDGSVLIADTLNHRIRMVSPSGRITTVAGNGNRSMGPPSWVGSAPATGVAITPIGMTADNMGNVFAADAFARRIYRITADGRMTSVVGGGTSSDDGVDAATVEYAPPPYGLGVGLAWDKTTHSLYFVQTEGGRSLIRVLAPNGKVYTVAGRGSPDLSGSQCNGDGDAAFNAYVPYAMGLVVGADSSLYFADFTNKRIRTITASTLAPGAGLSITKTLLNSSTGTWITVGRTATFEITVVNPRSPPAFDLVLKDGPPHVAPLIFAPVSITSSSWAACGVGNIEIGCKLSTLPTSNTATALVSVMPFNTATFCNKASVDASFAGIEMQTIYAYACAEGVAPQRSLDEFVLLAEQSMLLGATVTIRNGLAGVNLPRSPQDLVKLKAGSPVIDLAGDAHLIADTVSVAVEPSRRLMSRIIANEVNFNSANLQRRPGTFPLLAFPSVQSGMAGTTNITVLTGNTRHLAPGAYKDVVVKPGGTLILNGFSVRQRRLWRAGRDPLPTSYVFDSLSLMSGTDNKGVARHAAVKFNLPQEVSDHTRLNRRASDFSVGTQVWVAKSILAQAGTTVGPTRPGYDPALFQFHMLVGAAPVAVQLDDGVRVSAYFAAPDSSIIFGNGVVGIGQFVGKTITVGDRGVFSRN